jgi:hypothetical protein
MTASALPSSMGICGCPPPKVATVVGAGLDAGHRAAGR